MPNTETRLEAAIDAMSPRIAGRAFEAWAWYFDGTGRTEYYRQPLSGWEVIGKSPRCRRETPFLRVAAGTADGEVIEITE